MRVLVASGRVGELSPPEVARIVGAAWNDAAPHVEVEELPQIDGGIGTASVLAAADAADAAAVMIDADGTRVPAYVCADGTRAWLDAAESEAAGAPGSATLGAAVAALADGGVRTVTIGLSASAALDGGRGFVAALAGARDLDAGPDAVRRAAQRLAQLRITGLVDTDRQLLGFQGASFAAVEALGVSKESAQAAEQAMGEWLDVVRSAVPTRTDLLAGTTIRPERQPGAGAAGGLGFLLAALGSALAPAPAFGARVTGLAERVAAADLVVTATGIFDWRVLEHSVLAEVASIAGAAARPAVVLADEVHVGRREQMSLGLQGTYSISRSGWMRPEPLPVADLADALAVLTRRVAGTWTPAPRADVL